MDTLKYVRNYQSNMDVAKDMDFLKNFKGGKPHISVKKKGSLMTNLSVNTSIAGDSPYLPKSQQVDNKFNRRSSMSS